MPFKCYNREFGLTGSNRWDSSVVGLNVYQNDHTKICFSDGRTVSIQQSLTYVWDNGKPTTECKIKCEDDTSDTIPTVKLGYTQAEKEDWLEEEEKRCSDAYEAIANKIIGKYRMSLQMTVSIFLKKATEDQLRARFGKAIAFNDTNETNGPQASTTQDKVSLRPPSLFKGPRTRAANKPRARRGMPQGIQQRTRRGTRWATRCRENKSSQRNGAGGDVSAENNNREKTTEGRLRPPA